MSDSAASTDEVLVGRYFLFREIAAGGMASIHLARLLGPVGFGRTVAVKRLHPHYAREPDFVAMFVDEARIVTSIRHPNVVPVLDVVSAPGHLLLVMEYVHGEPVSKLFAAAAERKERVPPAIVSAVVIGLLEGLHAAHEARGQGGKLLEVIHRDVSPQNVLVGQDGMARVLDFGIAKATSQLHESTAGGGVKGKIKYMAPEQVGGKKLDRRVDVWASGVILWELLTGRRLWTGDNEGAIILQLLDAPVPPPGVSPALDAVALKALSRSPEERYPDARSMAVALEAACRPASPREVSTWVESLVGAALRERQALVNELEEVAQAGMPSVRTQLAFIADHARPSSVPPAPSVAPSPDATLEATAVVGGRPAATRSATGTDMFVGTSTASVPPAAPARGRLVPAIVAGAAVLAVGLGAGMFAVRQSTVTGAPTPTTQSSSAPPMTSPATPVSASAQASTTAPAMPSASVTAGPPTPTKKTPGKPRPDDGVRLDHRK